jgi:hypothetical protein
MNHVRWVPILYRDFWDVPRLIFVRSNARHYLLVCSFDDARDDYGDEYVVYLVPPTISVEDTKDWSDLLRAGHRIGVIPVSQVEFDETKRKGVSARVLELLNGLQPATRHS